MNKQLLLTVLVILGVSCTPGREFQVTKMGSEPEKSVKKAVYVLPETCFLIGLDLEKEIRIPGPYRLYAKKYLGLNEFIIEKETRYSISDVRVESVNEPDAEHFYSINLLKGEMDWDMFLKLSDYGFILDPVYSLKAGEGAGLPVDDQEEKLFSGGSMKLNLTETTDTLFKTVIRDSSFVRIPILRKQMAARTTEQKAMEAADLIMRIRSRKLSLISGEEEFVPDGEAIAVSVEELDKMEEEFMELFIGKRITQTFTRSFMVRPETKKTTQIKTFARFSPASGLLNPEDIYGNELVFELIPQGKTVSIEPFFRAYGDGALNTLFYRIPDVASVSVKLSGQVLYEGRFSVFQLGEVTGYGL